MTLEEIEWFGGERGWRSRILTEICNQVGDIDEIELAREFEGVNKIHELSRRLDNERVGTDG